jgi:hypothetical protein
MAAVFDEPNLIADAGLVPVVRLAEPPGLVELTEQAVRIAGAGNSGGANPSAKVMSLAAAMCAGADSVDDADRVPLENSVSCCALGFRCGITTEAGTISRCCCRCPTGW